LNGGIPEETCEKYPELKDSGLYRKLNNGQVEFISYCDDKILDFFSMHKDDLARILNEPEEASDSERVIEVYQN